MGLAMGLTAVAIIYSPWGKRSGAHINPATTLTFLRLGKVEPADALFYAVAQFAGAILGVARRRARAVRRRCATRRCTSPRRFPAARRGRRGLLAEVAITFILMTVVLARLERPAVEPLHGARRRRLRRALHHVRGADLGHEHEPGAHRSAPRSRRCLELALDLLRRAAARHAARGRSAPARRAASHSVLCAKLHHENHAALHLPLRLSGVRPGRRKESIMTSDTTTTSSSSAPAPAAARCSASLAPTGKRILLLERGDFVPREKDNWSSQAVNVDGKYQTKEVWRDKDGQASSTRTPTTTSAATPSSTARRSSGCARRTSASSATTAASRRPGRSPTTTWSPTTREAEQLYHVHGDARRGPDRAAGERARTRTRPSATSRASSSSRDDFARSGLKPFHVPLGIMLDEQNRATSPCIRCETCDGFPCLVHAKSDAQVCCVEPALAPPERHAADRTRTSRGSRPTPSGREVTKVVASSATALRRTYSADIVVVVVRRDQLGGAAAALGRTTSIPRGLANGSDVVGRHYMGHVNSVLMARLEVPEPDGLPEDARDQRLLLRLDGVGATRWATSPSSASSTARRSAGRGAGDRAGLHARADGQALARLLAHLRGPARSEQPRDARPRRQHRPRLPAEQRGGRTSGCIAKLKNAA